MISQGAIDLIVASEVTSKQAYDAKYKHPTWPGGASGVTIGIGYDLGYQTQAEIAKDWKTQSAAVLNRLIACAGVKGQLAQTYTNTMKDVVIPWDNAMGVFINHDIPKWEAICAAQLPNFTRLPADCKGALVSLAYNRGASFTTAGDRYKEMRAIRTNMILGNLDAIPEDFRAMKRLWPNMKGLRIRRDAEAYLFQKGLDDDARSAYGTVADNNPRPGNPGNWSGG